MVGLWAAAMQHAVISDNKNEVVPSYPKEPKFFCGTYACVSLPINHDENIMIRILVGLARYAAVSPYLTVRTLVILSVHTEILIITLKYS